MGLTFEIDGVDRRDWVEPATLQIHKEGHTERLQVSLVIDDISLSLWRPAPGAEVYITQDGELLFGGVIDSVDEDALAPPNKAGLRWRVAARDWMFVTEKTIVPALTIPAGSPLYTTAETIRETWLEPRWNIQPNGPTAGGPALPDLTFDHASILQIYDAFTTATGYFWRINGDKLFAIHAPGSITGPTFNTANANIVNDFAWRRAAIDRYTRIWLAVTIAEAPRTETHPGNGTRVRFALQFDVATPPITVTEITGETHTPYPCPGARWTYEALNQEIVQISGTPVPSGSTVETYYDIRLPGWARADAPGIALGTEQIIEGIFTATEITDPATALAAAQAKLDAQTGAPQEVTLETTHVNIFPDMACTVNIPERLVIGPYLVRSVNTTDIGRLLDQSAALLTRVDLVQGGENVPSWLDFWRDAVGGGGGGGVAVGPGGVPGPPVGIGPPGPPGATYLVAHLGGSRSRARTGSGPAPEWVPVIINAPLLSSTTMIARIECAVFGGGGTVTPKVTALVGATWIDVGVGVPATGAPDDFAYQEIDVTAQPGSVAYRLELIASIGTASVGGIGNVTAN